EGNECHKQVVKQSYRNADRRSHGRIEGTNFKLLVKGRNHNDTEQQRQANSPNRFRPDVDARYMEVVPRHICDLAIEHAVEIQIDLSCIHANQHYPDSKESSKDDTDGCIRLDTALMK